MDSPHEKTEPSAHRSAGLDFLRLGQDKAHGCRFPKIQRKYSGKTHVVHAPIICVRANRDGAHQRLTGVQLPTNRKQCATADFAAL
jgi:hypothetical protein